MLPDHELKAALERLQSLTVDDLIKQQVGDVLKAASKPNAERIDVVIRTLEPERKKLVTKTARQVHGSTLDVMSRGRAELNDLSAAEWDELVRKANGE